jgi:RNA polymerase-binding protein DksA
MEKDKLEIFKKRLEERKAKLEEELLSIAKKDPLVKGDYDANFPDFGTQSSDEEAFEVASYESNLSMEQAMEIKLAEIKAALERIEKGTYGQCENCNEEINEKRLEAMPEAKFCLKCQK